MSDEDKRWADRFWTKVMLTLAVSFILFVFTMASIVYSTRIDVNYLIDAKKETLTKADVIWYVKYRDSQNEDTKERLKCIEKKVFGQERGTDKIDFVDPKYKIYN